MKKLKYILWMLFASVFLSGCIETSYEDITDDKVSGMLDQSIADDSIGSLIPVSYDKICNGFLYQTNKDSVISIIDGALVSVPLRETQTTVIHNGQEISVEYSWAEYGNALAANSHSGIYSVVPLQGSNRYLQLIFDMGYTYLIDTSTKEVHNPLSALDSSITERLSIINFSDDGKFAVVSYNSGRDCLLLNCITGDIIQIPYTPNNYSISGYMLDHTHLMLISAFELEVPHTLQFSGSIYNLATRELTRFPEPYTTWNDSDLNCLRPLGTGRIAYFFDKNEYLVIVDQVSWERIVTQFRKEDVDDVFYCPNTLAGVICDDVIYIVTDYSGSTHAVCKTDK